MLPFGPVNEGVRSVHMRSLPITRTCCSIDTDPRDVATLAHELGHGVHGFLAREQGIFHQSTPLTLAETASVFGETVTNNRLLSMLEDPGERLHFRSNA